MDSSNTGLIVSVVSLVSALIVSVITTLSNVWQKTIDANQKNADRNQELRKIYILRKIEAGEAIINQLSAFIKKVDWIHATNRRYGFIQHADEKKMEELIAEEKLLDEGIRKLTYDYNDIGNAYFDNIAQHEKLINRLGVEFLESCLTFSKALQNKQGLYVMVREAKDAQALAALQNEINKADNRLKAIFNKVEESGDTYRNAILDLCSMIRNELSKYDLS